MTAKKGSALYKDIASIRDNKSTVGGAIGSSDGAFSMNLSLALAASLASPNPTQERVFIRADKHVRFKEFMDVINQLQTDGFYKIGLISENLE